jgi:energy-coupling factor transporter ATP-binding protein EcfA2
VKNFLYFSLIISLVTFVFVEGLAQHDEKKEDQDGLSTELVKKIGDINLHSFPREDHWWEAHTWVEYVTKAMNFIRNPFPAQKRQNTFYLFEKSENFKDVGVPSTNSEALWQDLNLFCGKDRSPKCVANAIDRTSTEVGKVSLFLLLAQPTADPVILKQRQALIRFFVQHPKLVDVCQKVLSNIAQSENYMLTFWGRESVSHATEECYFKHSFVKFLNRHDAALFGKSVFDHTNRAWHASLKIFASAILLIYGSLIITGHNQIPQQIERWADRYSGQGNVFFSLLWMLKNKWVHSLLSIFTGVWCLASLPQEYDHIYGTILLDKSLQEIMHHMATVMRNMHILYECVKMYPELAAYPEIKPVITFFEEQAVISDEVRELVGLMGSSAFEGSLDFWVNKGVVLRAFKLADTLKNTLKKAVIAMARVDAFLSLAKLVKEFENKHVHFSYPVYDLDSKAPVIKLADFWHPLVSVDCVVPNSITLGGDKRANVILTGPNEGGKSTILKTITLCVLMAQTCGIVPAQAMTVTPFSVISTYLNITDDIGAGNSLFKAEVLRAQQLIDQIATAKPGVFNFSVFDEMFNGTSPIEGAAAAYSVAKHLSTYPQSISLIATHFSLLTQLEGVTQSFKNYKVSVVKNPDGSIFYPHKLEEGASTQHIALDILRNQGFASSIIKDAQLVIQQQM